jgi:hypothetical protein
MDIQDFLLWLERKTGEQSANVSLLEEPVQAPYWAEVVKDMRPSYYGEMPPAIVEAFPNETPHQHKYRLDIFRSATKELLWQAISDVKRLVMSDKFAIESGAGLKPLIHSNFYGITRRVDFEKYIFNTVYPRRVLDPNALLASIPISNPANLSEPVAVDLRIFSSSDILYFSRFLIIVFDRYKTDRANDGVCIYRAFTPTHQIEIVKTQDSRTEQSWFIDPMQTYVHNSNDLGVTVLGGREITVFDASLKLDITYYEGDFSCAVPAMDTLDRTNNQLQAATLRTVFPHMVTQGIKCEATGCNGGMVTIRDKDGEIVYKNIDSPNPEPIEKPCKKCGGKGTVSLSVLDNITITPPNNDIFDEDGKLKISGNLADKIIGFAAPDISSIKELREQKAEAKADATEALNLVKPSKFAESGVSKEKDREGKSTALQDISDGMAMMAKGTLVSMASLRFINTMERDDEIKAIRIIQPEDFEIKPVEELSKEFFDNLMSKPIALRQMQYNQLLLKRFKNNPEMVLLNNIAFAYTNGLHLETQKELADKVSAGFITREEAVKALKISPVLKKLVRMGNIDVELFSMVEDMERLRLQIDMEMFDFVEAVNNANSNQATFSTPPPIALGASDSDFNDDSDDD